MDVGKPRNSRSEDQAMVLQEQRQLVAALQAEGRSDLARELSLLHADQQKSLLCADIYEVVKGEGQSPYGWMRGSSNFDALRSAGFEMTDEEFRELLTPEKSGFRAEIYLPDPSVHGADAKPVVVLKGSAGEIIDTNAPDGLRSSTAEDFGNNTQQGLGLRSDYYDRAMRLAVRLNELAPGQFELAGHSLAGGMVSAAAAVTGVRATTFNPAGLHPNTARRFAEENGLPLHDPDTLVRGYRVHREVLNDMQEAVGRMPHSTRDEVEPVLRLLADAARQPRAREWIMQALGPHMSEQELALYLRSAEYLGSPEGAGALQRLPRAVGQMRELLPLQRNLASHALEPQPAGESLSAAIVRAAPYLGALQSGAAVARATGEGGLAIGSHVGTALHWQAGVVEKARDVSVAALSLGAGTPTRVSDAVHTAVPWGLSLGGQALARQAGRLTTGVADSVEDGLAVFAGRLRNVGDVAELALPVAAVATAAATQTLIDDSLHYSPAIAAYGLYKHYQSAGDVAGHIKAAMGRAGFAHSQRDSVIPSLDGLVHNTEQGAYAHLAAVRGRQEGALDNYRLDQPGHEGHRLYAQALAGVHRLDRQVGREPDGHSDCLAGALAVQAHKAGMTRIDQVLLSGDASRVFAVDNPAAGVEHRKRAEVAVVDGRNTPLEHSTAVWEEHDQRRALLERTEPAREQGISEAVAGPAR